MKLTPHELDKNVLQCAGGLAQRRLARGIRLNVPEATALLLTRVLEMVREGVALSSIMSQGRGLLGRRQVIPGVESILDEVQIEATFPDGTKLITLHHPICLEDGDLAQALHGSFLPVPAVSAFPAHPEEGLKPGCVYTVPTAVKINAGRAVVELPVTNRCDRPIQVRAVPP
jgi:urease subunit gamma/beta